MGTDLLAGDRSAAVASMTDEELDHLLLTAQQAGVSILRQPRSGMLMKTVLDAFDAPFHLGEVLVSEAEVALGDYRGYGMILGEQPRHALARACAEALLDGADEVTVARVQKLIDTAAARQQQQHQKDEELIARTRVRFDLMAGS